MEASRSHVLIMGAANSGCSHFWIPTVVNAAISGMWRGHSKGKNEDRRLQKITWNLIVN